MLSVGGLKQFAEACTILAADLCDCRPDELTERQAFFTEEYSYPSLQSAGELSVALYFAIRISAPQGVQMGRASRVRLNAADGTQPLLPGLRLVISGTNDLLGAVVVGSFVSADWGIFGSRKARGLSRVVAAARSELPSVGIPVSDSLLEGALRAWTANSESFAPVVEVWASESRLPGEREYHPASVTTRVRRMNGSVRVAHVRQVLVDGASAVGDLAKSFVMILAVGAIGLLGLLAAIGSLMPEPSDGRIERPSAGNPLDACSTLAQLEPLSRRYATAQSDQIQLELARLKPLTYETYPSDIDVFANFRRDLGAILDGLRPDARETISYFDFSDAVKRVIDVCPAG